MENKRNLDLFKRINKLKLAMIVVILKVISENKEAQRILKGIDYKKDITLIINAVVETAVAKVMFERQRYKANETIKRQKN